MKRTKLSPNVRVMKENPKLWAQYYQALAQGDPGRASQILSMINQRPNPGPFPGGGGCCNRRFPR